MVSHIIPEDISKLYRYPPFNQVPKSNSGHKEAMFSLFYWCGWSGDHSTRKIWLQMRYDFFLQLNASFYIVGYLPKPIIQNLAKTYIVKIKNLAYLCHFFTFKIHFTGQSRFFRSKNLQKIHLKRSLEGWSLHELDEFNYYLVNAFKGPFTMWWVKIWLVNHNKLSWSLRKLQEILI